MKWLDTEKFYENAMQNSIYKMINNKDDHYFKTYLTEDRTLRIHKQNKVRHHNIEMGHSQQMQKSYLYRALNIYNKLPRNLTLIKSAHLFKKWVKRYNLNKNIKLKEQIDNEEPMLQDVNEEEEEECYDMNNDEDE